MKTILTPLLVFALAACSPSGSKESISQDSTLAASDSLVTIVSDTAVVSVQAAIEEAYAVDYSSDTSELGKSFYEIYNGVTEKKDQYYIVTISISQYEGGSDATWYFDKDISPVYYSESWAMEGNEGTTEYFITSGTVVLCALSRATYSEDKWCSDTGGTSTDESSSESTTTPLPDDYGTKANEYLKRAFENLLQLMNQCEVTEKSDTDYTLRMETIVDVGQEVTETAEIHIPRAVYKELVGE